MAETVWQSGMNAIIARCETGERKGEQEEKRERETETEKKSRSDVYLGWIRVHLIRAVMRMTINPVTRLADHGAL